MSQDVIFKRSHQTFPGAQTNTIAMDATHAANVVYMDIFVPAVCTIDVKVGSLQLAKGTIAAESSPVQLRFGSGVGSGGFGDNIVIITSAAAEIFVGYTEYKKLN